MRREEWRPAPGHNGYEVSNQGRVRSVKGALPKVLRATTSTPYLRVSLSHEGHRTNGYVHRLVALAFLGTPSEGMQVRHLNGDRQDNVVTNLAWGTPAENMLDVVAHGNHLNARRTHCKHGHEFTPENTRNRRRKCVSGWTFTRECRACERTRPGVAA